MTNQSIKFETTLTAMPMIVERELDLGIVAIETLGVTLPWSNAATLPWSNSATLPWSNAATLPWSNAATLPWSSMKLTAAGAKVLMSLPQ